MSSELLSSHNLFYFDSLLNYRPQTKVREGNVFTPVCHSVHRGCLPLPLGLGLCVSVSGSRGVCTPLWADTPLGKHLHGQTPPGQTPTPPPENTACDVREMTIEAGATHPTGMHSCLTQ